MVWDFNERYSMYSKWIKLYLTFFCWDTKLLNLDAITTPVIKSPVQVANMDLLSAATLGWLTAKSVAHVMIFIGTLNQFVTVALWLSGISWNDELINQMMRYIKLGKFQSGKDTEDYFSHWDNSGLKTP